MLNNGSTFKRRTQVDIPLDIALPHFISDEETLEDGPAMGNFKLSLQSFVCHEGKSVTSGHYIAFSRTPDSTNSGRDHWIRFDDLAKERVIEVSIEDRLKRESPYLLFYQVMPIEDTASPPNGQEPTYCDAPPSYAESNASKASQPGVSSTETSLGLNASEETGIPRISRDISISEDEQRGRSDMNATSNSEVMHRTGSNTAAAESTITETERVGDTTKAADPGSKIDEESIKETLAELSASRRGSNISKTSNRSRPSSSSGENKFSASFTRLSKRMSGDKLSNMPEKEARPAFQGTAQNPFETENVEIVSKSKKESRDKSRLGRKEHHLRIKAKKPDRECILM